MAHWSEEITYIKHCPYITIPYTIQIDEDILVEITSLPKTPHTVLFEGTILNTKTLEKTECIVNVIWSGNVEFVNASLLPLMKKIRGHPIFPSELYVKQMSYISDPAPHQAPSAVLSETPREIPGSDYSADYSNEIPGAVVYKRNGIPITTYIEKYKTFPDVWILHFMKKLFCGVYNMSKLGVLLENINASNIYITRDSVEIYDLSKVRSFSQNQPSYNIVWGHYGSPDILYRLYWNPAYTNAWAVSICAFICANGNVPFTYTSCADCIQKIYNHELNWTPQCSPLMKYILKQLLDPNPSTRMNCKNIIYFILGCCKKYTVIRETLAQYSPPPGAVVNPNIPVPSKVIRDAIQSAFDYPIFTEPSFSVSSVIRYTDDIVTVCTISPSEFFLKNFERKSKKILTEEQISTIRTGFEGESAPVDKYYHDKSVETYLHKLLEEEYTIIYRDAPTVSNTPASEGVIEESLETPK